MPSSANRDPNAPASEEVAGWVDMIMDGGDGNVPRQIFLGGTCGWITGFLAMRLGRSVATAVGGGIILLQLARYNRIIDIDWNRANRKLESAHRKATGESKFSNKFEHNLDKAADKAQEFFNKGERGAKRWYNKMTTGEDPRLNDLQVFMTAFAGGLALGLLTS